MKAAHQARIACVVMATACLCACSSSPPSDDPSPPSDSPSVDAGHDAASAEKDAASSAPVVTITDPPAKDSWIPARRARIAGSVASSGVVTIEIRANGTPIGGDAAKSSFDIVFDPPAGLVDVEIRAKDGDGREASSKVTLHVGSEVAAGLGHSGAIASGVAKTWGSNGSGELGREGETQAAALAVGLGATKATSLAFTSGAARSFALDASGSVWTWGGTTGAAPISIGTADGAVQLAAGGGHVLVLTSFGAIYASGANGAGQLGTGNTEPVSALVSIASLTKVVSACAGSTHSVAVTENGNVWAWGANDRSQLGHGAADALPHPSPSTVALPSAATDVACGRDHTLARLADGSVWAWGVGSSGQLGHGGSGNLEDRAQPERVLDLSARHVVAAANSSWAIDETGRLFAWGQNSFGQLGVGTTSEKAQATLVTAIRDVIGIAGGGTHAVFRTADGKTWTSGHNGSLQLGRAGAPSLAPIEVSVP